ncbi:TniB family NTP-binding protein [Pseudomonas sp. NPDC077186]|uniref:TniB family NTP-binding protein n=1 Tax=Pseudomonas sp. NPDC077186 TaxID=3364421 RepID=UPI0037C90701
MSSPLTDPLQRKPHTVAFLQRTFRNKQFDEATEAIRRSHKTTQGKNPKSLMLLGPSGAGKSTIVDTYRHFYPDVAREDRIERPILYVSLHARVRVNDILSALLDACGDPEPDKGTTRALIRRFNRLASSLCVKLIIIDEIQHVLPEHTHGRTQEAADTIKSITRDTQIPFVLVGLPHASRLLTDTIKGKHEEDQLLRRFNASVEIMPAALGSKAWKNLMAGYQQIIGVPCINLTDEEMLKRIHLATSGLHGFVSNLLEHALEETDGKEQVCIKHLARAFEFTTGSLSKVGNPFLLPMPQVERALALRANV